MLVMILHGLEPEARKSRTIESDVVDDRFADVVDGNVMQCLEVSLEFGKSLDRSK